MVVSRENLVQYADLPAMEEIVRFSVSSLRPTLKRVIEGLLDDRSALILTPEVWKHLLLNSTTTDKCTELSKEVTDEVDTSLDALALRFISSYPASPLYVRLADIMSCWIVTGDCPVFALPTMFLLEEHRVDERKEVLEAVGRHLKEVYITWEASSPDEQQLEILQALKMLGLRGILDLLGLRCTSGSCELLPPPRGALLASFTKQHSPPAQLSVGGRALSKHCHRDASRQWWGGSTGSESAKNECALRVALKILNSAVWINIHTLPHDIHVLEVRHREGYGLRWSSDGSEFRGFLEPQMQDGHSAGWRH